MPSENTGKKRVETNIRQMEIDDISAVYHMGEELFTSDEFPILYRTWDQYEVTDYFTSDPEYCMIAETEPDGKIIGFIIGTTIEKEGTAWKKYGYISWIGVAEDFQRTNLGIRLYKRLEQRLRKDGVRMVIADTDSENEPAISFFKSLGFYHSSEHVWLAKTIRRSTKENSRSDNSSKTA